MLPCHPTGVVVMDRDHLKEVFEATDADLNFTEATLEHTDVRYTFRGNIYHAWHVPIVRNQLTQNLPALIPEMVDEMTSCIADEFETVITDGISRMIVFS
jgi:hypothetical protein